MADSSESATGKEEQQNVKVMVRVRPFNSREMEISKKKGEPSPDCVVQMRDNTCVVVEHYRDEKGFRAQREREAFQFDECFWSLKPGTGDTTPAAVLGTAIGEGRA